MLTYIYFNFFLTPKWFLLGFSTAAPQEKWDLLTAVCLERKPIITQELTEIEKEFKDYLAQVELERSLRNDFEIKHDIES